MGSDTLIRGAGSSVVRSRSSFATSFAFLPDVQRKEINLVYDFCRATDDIVDNDEPVSIKEEKLQQWNEELASAIAGHSNNPLLTRIVELAERRHIDHIHFFDLIRGADLDLRRNRYPTFDELREYCLLVASSVGLMCVGIFGARFDHTREYATNLGIALQLTNILRDVGADSRWGRIYIPTEDLDRFQVPESDLLDRRFSPAFASLMEFESDRAESFFMRAANALPAEDRRSMAAAIMMEKMYHRLLRNIQRSGYDVFGSTIRVGRPFRIAIAVSVWIRTRMFSA